MTASAIHAEPHDEGVAGPQSEAGAALIWCPFADAASAAEVAGKLLDERLIVCANIMPPMHSLFRWQGERGEAEECGALLKTDAALLERAARRLEQLHPYDTPAVVGWRADIASAATVSWLRARGEAESADGA